MTTNKPNVHQRLAAVMSEVTYIQKEAKKGMNYTIVSHDAVTAKVRPVLLKHGIVYYPVRCDHHHDGNRAECAMTVRFVNVDAPSDFFDVPTFGYGIDTQDKGPGKAMSYAVKYALLKALGLETGDDPDLDNVNYEQDAAPRVEEKASASNYVPILNAITAAKNMGELQAAFGVVNSDKTLSKDDRLDLAAAKDEMKAKLMEDDIPYAGNADPTSSLDRLQREAEQAAANLRAG